MADVIGPSGSAVRFARKWVGFGSRLCGPCSAERCRSEGPEVTSVGTDRFHNHEIFVESCQGVHLDCLEEVVGRIAKHDRGRSAEASREVPNGHARTIDLTIVTCEEQIHGRAIRNERLINRTRAASRYRSREERLRSGPTVRVRRVGGSLVREGGWAPLVRKYPGALRSKVEQRGSDRGSSLLGLTCGCQIAEVRNEPKGHGTPCRS